MIMISFVLFSDVGGPQLSMHSIREMCCSSIIYQETHLFKVMCYCIFWCVVVVVVSLGISANLRENELKVVVLLSFLFCCQNFLNELPSVLGCLTGAD